ncbi:spore coat protein GerQ [Paenibacillus thermoaerophilus]|nr:spore coat protein GerQ [Paenibacillus thermoaerophilus]
MGQVMAQQPFQQQAFQQQAFQPQTATAPQQFAQQGGPLAPAGSTIPGVPVPPGQLPAQESYIENILRLNLGKIGTFYMTYENNREWNAKIFKGRLEAAGRDHIIISDPQTGQRILLLMINFDYATFDEPLNYYYPYAGGAGPGQPQSR